MNLKFIDKPEDVDELISWIRQQKLIGVDTETTSLDPLTSKILLLQLGTISRQYVLDTARLGREKIIQVIEALNEPAIIKIFHNSNFDYQQIKSNYGIELMNVKCTMLGEQLLNQGRKNVFYSLDAIAKKYLGTILDKSVRETFQYHRYGEHFSDIQINYAAEDVLYLGQLYKKIQTLLDERNMTELSELEYETSSVLGDMTLNGIYLDKEKWIPLEEKAKVAIIEAKAKLDTHFKEFIDSKIKYDLFGPIPYEINYDSPKQVLPLLKETTGLELSSTDAKYLDYFKDRNEVIADLVKYRQVQKRITTYGITFLDNISSVDNRIHSRFRQLKAQTGRMSSDNPNMQNLPKDQAYRTPFGVQDPTWNFISADFSGQELRLLAHASQETEMINALKKGIDLHTYSASLLFNKDYKSITNAERKQCKAITFALLYGAGPKKLATQLRIPYEDAKALLTRYFTVFPKVHKFMSEVVERMEKEHYALSPLDGRRVDLSGLDWDNRALVAHSINQAKNLPFQGCGASTIKLALVRIKNRIKKEKLNARIVNAVHDEILCDVSPEHTEATKITVEEEMIKAFNHYAPSVPMEVVAEVGKHWIH